MLITLNATIKIDLFSITLIAVTQIIAHKNVNHNISVQYYPSIRQTKKYICLPCPLSPRQPFRERKDSLDSFIKALIIF
jgi:hypothetical protein